MNIYYLTTFHPLFTTLPSHSTVLSSSYPHCLLSLEHLITWLHNHYHLVLTTTAYTSIFTSRSPAAPPSHSRTTLTYLQTPHTSFLPCEDRVHLTMLQHIILHNQTYYWTLHWKLSYTLATQHTLLEVPVRQSGSSPKPISGGRGCLSRQA